MWLLEQPYLIYIIIYASILVVDVLIHIISLRTHIKPCAYIMWLLEQPYLIYLGIFTSSQLLSLCFVLLYLLTIQCVSLHLCRHLFAPCFLIFGLRRHKEFRIL